MAFDPNENLEDFFKRILSKDVGTIQIFLADYPVEIVIKYLLDEIQRTDDPWKLGRVLGALEKRANRYGSTDSHMYSHYEKFSIKEKVNILDFLSGYWDSVGAKLEFVIEIGEEIIRSIDGAQAPNVDVG